MEYIMHRKPVVAGSFYPKNPGELNKMIEQYLSDASSDAIEGVVGIISPHAGYIYSGPVAAYSFKQLKQSGTEVVIVLAPSHRARFDGASVITNGLYETPLGNVEIDSTIGNQLDGEEYFGFIQNAHEMEHSLEVQVPFLQKVLDNFTIVPIIIGTVKLEICKQIASAISDILKNEKRKWVIVVSTDLSHYHSDSIAKEMDKKFIDTLQSMDEHQVKDIIESGSSEACGEGPVLTGLMISKNLGASKCKLLKYMNSGDTAGGKDQVVGYMAAAFVK